MRINLINIGEDFEEQYGGIALLKGEHQKIIPDSFVIDTGSPKTVIPYDKALRLQISFSRKFPKLICLGGHKYSAYEANNLEFIFEDSNQNKVVEPFSCLVLKPTSKKKEEELGHFPIILGIDFLKERRYNLIFNFKENIFCLEKF